MSDSKELTVADVSNHLLDSTPPAQKAQAILSLGVERGTLALVGAWERHFQSVSGVRIEDEKERVGNCFEQILEEMSDEEERAFVCQLISRGDFDILHSMIRGNMGGISSTVDSLSANDIVELFESDPERSQIYGESERDPVYRERVFMILYTLVAAWDDYRENVAKFLETKTAIGIIEITVQKARKGNEDAQELLGQLEHIYGFPQFDIEEEDIEDEDEKSRV